MVEIDHCRTEAIATGTTKCGGFERPTRVEVTGVIGPERRDGYTDNLAAFGYTEKFLEPSQRLRVLALRRLTPRICVGALAAFVEMPEWSHGVVGTNLVQQLAWSTTTVGAVARGEQPLAERGGLSHILAYGQLAAGLAIGRTTLDGADGMAYRDTYFGPGTPFGGRYVGCTGSAGQCTSGQVYGLGDPTSPVRDVPLECVPANARALGETCLLDDECASASCTVGVCSTCRTNNSGCATGELCGPAWPLPDAVHTPYVCSPDAHLRRPDEPCASDDDCASASCNGAPRRQCDDGRSCATAADCPFGGPSLDNLQNGPCTTVGIQGGSCQ